MNSIRVLKTSLDCAQVSFIWTKIRTARHFMRRLDVDQKKAAREGEEMALSDARTHGSVAALYHDALSSTKHWTILRLVMSDWRKYDENSPDDGSFPRKLEIYDEDSSEILLIWYLARYGLRHHHLATKNKSSPETSCKTVIDELITPSQSTYALMLLFNEGVNDRIWDEPVEGLGNHFLMETKPWTLSCLHIEQGKLQVLPWHIIACLNAYPSYASLHLGNSSAASTNTT